MNDLYGGITLLGLTLLKKINTLELDYTILEIITQKEHRGRQIEYAR